MFVYEHDDKGSQGVILSKASAFTMGEVSPDIGPFKANKLYMGGESGSDTAIMLHTHEMPGASKYIGHGIFLGGLKSAKRISYLWRSKSS